MARLIALQSAPNGVLSDVGTGGKLEPLVGHQVYVYQPGTLTQVQVWQDEGGSTTLSQPLTTDSTGAIPGYAQAEQAVDFYDATAGLRIRSQLISAADMSDVLAQQLPVLPPVQVVATTNQSLSGLRTIDTYALQANDTILLTGQTDPKQNGPWKVASGAWTRPSVFASSSIVTAREVSVINGSAARQRWMLVTNTSITVDVSSQTWTLFPQAGIPAPDPQNLKRGYGGSSDWNTAWKPARALANASSGSRLVTVMNFGASVAAGCYVGRVGARDDGSGGKLGAQNWFGQIVDALQAIYGDGGSGWISAHEAIIPNARVTTSGGGAVGALGADWVEFGYLSGVENFGGYNGYGITPNTAAHGSVTFNAVRGKHIVIMYYPTGSTSAQFAWNIDGGAGGSGVVNTNQTADTLKVSTIITPTPVSGHGDWHTVTIAPTIGQPTIFAVGGFNDNGIIGHNVGHGGRVSANATTNTFLSAVGWRTTAEATLWGVPRALTPVSGGFPTTTAPDLVIISDDMAINAFLTRVTPHGPAPAHAAGLAILCQNARQANPNCEIIIVGHPLGHLVLDTGTGLSAGPDIGYFPQYHAAARGIANAYGAAYVDLDTILRNSSTTADAVAGGGYFGTNPTSGGSPTFTDGDGSVHPGLAGHTMLANAVIPLVEA